MHRAGEITADDADEMGLSVSEDGLTLTVPPHVAFQAMWNYKNDFEKQFHPTFQVEKEVGEPGSGNYEPIDGQEFVDKFACQRCDLGWRPGNRALTTKAGVSGVQPSYHISLVDSHLSDGKEVMVDVLLLVPTDPPSTRGKVRASGHLRVQFDVKEDRFKVFEVEEGKPNNRQKFNKAERKFIRKKKREEKNGR